MAKTTNRVFKAYDLQRKKQHTIPSPPVQTQKCRLDAREWAEFLDNKPTATTRSKAKRSGKKRRIPKRTPAKKPPQRPFDVLVASPFDDCLECGQTGDDPACGIRCYQKFRKQYVANLIDIKGPGLHGYGAFTKPGVTISKGQYLDEYIGEVRPMSDELNISTSLYLFHVPGSAHECYIDGEKAGNWTRFVNSHCKPNVRPFPACVDRRHVMVFEALRDIGPEEELTFYYGKSYFNAAGFDCRCDAYKKPHVPRGE